MICTDCKGSGKYTGLTTIENCQLCNGDGNIPDPALPEPRWDIVAKALKIMEDGFKAKIAEKHDLYNTMIQKINVSVDLGREQILELGRKGPYKRFLDFPYNGTEILQCKGVEFIPMEISHEP